jgi:transcriptional regulator with XRE-family HTH domain
MYRECRNGAGFSIESASEAIGVAPRTLSAYEAGDIIPDAEKAMKMSKAYGRPDLAQWHCRNACAIGRAYHYELLDGVSDDPLHMLEKLEEETEEMLDKIKQARRALINSQKTSWCDKTISTVTSWVREMFDVEHTIEKIKVEFGRILDMRTLVSEHNQKCLERGYIRKER